MWWRTLLGLPFSCSKWDLSLTQSLSSGEGHLFPHSPGESIFEALQHYLDITHIYQIQVLDGIPDLAGRLAQANLLGPESSREQKEAGLDLLTEAERRRLRSENERYRDKFGFTFVICARRNKAAAILEGLSSRWSALKLD